MRLAGPLIAVLLVFAAGAGGLYAVQLQLADTDLSEDAAGEAGPVVEQIVTGLGLPVALLLLVAVGVGVVAFIVSVAGSGTSGGLSSRAGGGR